MKNADAFSELHPIVNFLFFALVIAFSMLLMHPVCLAVSLLSSLAYGERLRGEKALRLALCALLPMALLAAIVNPAFSHEGVTMLCYLPSGNPLTLESMLYGAAAGVMLSACVMWFSCVNEVITSDKLVYLIGRFVPALSLLLSMALRFFPRFLRQLRLTSQAQKCLCAEKKESLLHRMRHAVRIFSIVVTWSLENAIETADSMRSRGYGLPGRSAFSVFRLDRRDKAVLAWLLFCGAFILSGVLAGGMAFRYYPSLRAAPVTPMSAAFFLCYLALSLTPVYFDLREDRKWNALRYEA